jgi:hypothetical protein
VEKNYCDFDGNWQSISITNLDIADGIVACNFNKPCEVEITTNK